MTKQFRPRGVEADGLKYYQEGGKSGDYLSVDPSTNEHYIKNMGGDYFEARATAISGLITSVCTTAVSRGWLRSNCRRVRKATIPAEWLEVL